MSAAAYEVRCFLCGAEVGLIRGGRFVHDPACTRPLPRRAGLLRCCGCAGPLYLEAILEPELLTPDPERPARRLGAGVA